MCCVLGTGTETKLTMGPRLGCSNAYSVVLALNGGDWAVETIEKLPEGVQPQISVEELLLCEEIIRADERVRKLAKDVGKCFLLTSLRLSGPDQCYVES